MVRRHEEGVVLSLEAWRLGVAGLELDASSLSTGTPVHAALEGDAQTDEDASFSVTDLTRCRFQNAK
jgi:hypothetical protein